jgi:simple sugar transport system ATP-binding protein
MDHLMTGPRLDVNDVTMKFGDFAALSHVTASFAPGKVHAVVGQNGAGKTTFARVVCGLYDPTEGAVELDGRASTWCTSTSPLRRR